MENNDKDYLNEIDRIQNKLKCKLSQERLYKPNKHYEYLSNNKNGIKIEILKSIIPFVNQYTNFNPFEFLKQLILDLNNGESQRILFYKGYMRLIEIRRGCWSGGSQVNRTLIGRETLMYELDNMDIFKDKIFYENKKVNMIIGMLLFLECLKICVCKQRDEGKDGEKGVMESFRGRLGDRGNGVNMGKQRFLWEPYGNKDYLGFKLLSKQAEESYLVENPSLLRRMVSVPVRKEPFNFMKKLDGKQQSYSQYYESRPQKLSRIFKNGKIQGENRGTSLELDYLRRFSKDKNVWKNVGQRNLRQKMCQQEAVIYDDNMSIRNYALKTPRNKNVRIFSTLQGKTTGLSYNSRS